MASIETYGCNECPKSFVLLGQYNQHLKTHSRPYPCHNCAQAFALRSDLNRHVNARHRLGQSKHPCVVDGCQFMATRKDNVRQHLRKSHPGHPLAPYGGSKRGRAIKLQASHLHDPVAPRNHLAIMQVASAGNIGLMEVTLRRGFSLTMQADDGSTALHCAVKADQSEMVRLLLRWEAPLEVSNLKSRTAMDEAILDHNHGILEILLQHGATISKLGLEHIIEHGQSGLFEDILSHLGDEFVETMGQIIFNVASAFGQSEILSSLLRHSTIHREWIMTHGVPAIHATIVHGRQSIFDCITASGKLDPNMSIDRNLPSRKRSLLHLTATKGRVGMVDTLLRCDNILVNPLDTENYTPLHRAAAIGHIEVVKALLSHPQTSISETSSGRATALHLAARGGHAEVVQALIKHQDISLNAKDASGQTPLQIGIAFGALEVVMVMLNEPDVDVAVEDRHGATLLQLAVQQGHQDMVKTLLRHPRIERCDTRDLTSSLLRRAAWRLQWRVVRLLLNYEHDPSVLLEEFTPESESEGNISMGVLEALLKRESFSITEQDHNGQTLFHRAAKYGQVDIIERLLKSEQLDPNVADRKGWTPIHVAIGEGHLDALKAILQDERVDINAHGPARPTALQFARRRSTPDMVEMLLHHMSKVTSASTPDARRSRDLSIELDHEDLVSSDVPETYFISSDDEYSEEDRHVIYISDSSDEEDGDAHTHRLWTHRDGRRVPMAY